MNDSDTQELIKLHVAAVVPMMIRDLEQIGGITLWHLEQVRGHLSRCPRTLSAYGSRASQVAPAGLLRRAGRSNLAALPGSN